MSAAFQPDALPHIPVMLDEAIAALAPGAGETHVDATCGAGSYSCAILASGAELHAFDRDPDARAAADRLAAEGGARFHFHNRPFSELFDALSDAGALPVQGVVFDLGVSSMQLDQAGRGFSFRTDGPLDMRMAQAGESAADFLNGADETLIADVLYLYGEERQSRRIARAIVAARPLSTTGEFADVVRKAIGYRPGAPKDPATRSFQAVRIHVNRELDELKAGLAAAERALAPGGRLVVVSFHSLEDRIVKRFLRDRSGGAAQTGSRHLPVAADDAPRPSFAKPARPVQTGAAEAERNPRARSAILRSAIRTSEPAWTGKDIT